MSYLAVCSKGGQRWLISFFPNNIMYNGEIYGNHYISGGLCLEKNSNLKDETAIFHTVIPEDKYWLLSADIKIYYYDFVAIKPVFTGIIDSIEHKYGVKKILSRSLKYKFIYILDYV